MTADRSALLAKHAASLSELAADGPSRAMRACRRSRCRIVAAGWRRSGAAWPKADTCLLPGVVAAVEAVESDRTPATAAACLEQKVKHIPVAAAGRH